MEPTNLLLAQALSLSGLVGASGAYAGILRRRRDRQGEAALASNAAAERVDRHMALARIDHTFVKSAVRHQHSGQDRRPGAS
ncbi:MAG TPA: hypothetical protein VF364_12290 [Candidatus Limnocylindria bacterium]